MAYNRRKRKVKKNIPEAQAHISSSYNNTLVTITDKEGNTISWASSGTIGYKGSKKKTLMQKVFYGVVIVAVVVCPLEQCFFQLGVQRIDFNKVVVVYF